jgi:hypothetical protein
MKAMKCSGCETITAIAAQVGTARARQRAAPSTTVPTT